MLEHRRLLRKMGREPLPFVSELTKPFGAADA
jgi:hypothetical protein